MSIPTAAVEQYKLSQRLQAVAQLGARDAWSQVQVGLLTQSWEIILRNSGILDKVSALQVRAAMAGASYGASTLAAQGAYVAPDSFVNPEAFGGWSSDGRSLAGSLYSAVPYTKNLIAGGMAPIEAKAKGGAFLEMKVKTEVADAGRSAAGVDIASRQAVGYVRMLNPPSCSRCSVLAGRFYRWNAGFDRHPGCDCIHVPSKGADAAKSEGLFHDPYEYFGSLSAADQDRIYTKAGAQAIRDGSDLFQVVNSRRGMKPGGLLTTEGTTKRGNFGKNGPRLTPEAIYGKGLSRAETLKELERYGYILPGGQNPLGVIRGQAEGFGALGRGGTRVGVRESVLRARETGVRDPLNRATMTAAERRSFDAQANWDAVRAGRNPYTNAKAAKVTPEVAARAELAYRKELSLVKVEPRTVAGSVKMPPKVLSGQPLADTVTYHSTLHMSDGDLAEMMSKYADDPAVFDKIMDVMDERDAKYMTVQTTTTGAKVASLDDKPPVSIKLDPSPVTNPVVRKTRNLTQAEKASEEYQNYAMSQYSRALDDLNGVLLNDRGKQLARAGGRTDLEMDVFMGSATTARKYASEELLRWWEEQGRETLGSFRYKMYGWSTDRKAAQTVRNLGYERGQAFRDRSQF